MLRRLSSILMVLMLMIVFCVQFIAVAESVVPIGSGSYASEPPLHEGQAIYDFAVRPNIFVASNETRPLPTNDWWSNLLFRGYGSTLWAYPQAVGIEATQVNIFYPTTWNSSGTDMIKEYPVVLKGDGFTFGNVIAKDWNDWGVITRISDNSGRYMDITTAHGIPMTYVEISGFNPRLETGSGVSFFNDSGAAVSFPYVADHLGIQYAGRCYGIHAPANTTFTLSGTTLNVNINNNGYIVVSVLPAKSDLAYYHQYAYSIPRNTVVNWTYSPQTATVGVTWNVTTTNLRGGAERNVIQGFIPHHYKNTIQSVSFNGRTYASPRGQIRCAVGTNFSFAYKMTGILPSYPAPVTEPGVANTYNPSIMSQMIDSFATKTGYGGDTYWGGKDLVLYAKYTLFAKAIGHSAYESLKAKTREALVDWLTYTPGETEHYFAWYPRWKALVGFNPSYGSEQFTDNHFHYGYLIHAAALYGMVDKDFLNQYKGILTMIVKQYAGYMRDDPQFPLFRTFDPWCGHSYAGGSSSGNGNNQESTSEAIQSWVGMFLLGCVLGDNAMRDAGAFGYMSETAATLEYWFDWDDENFSPNYTKSVIGVLWQAGGIYGTYFSGDPHHIHGIQYLPICPGFSHFARNLTWATEEYNAMMSETQAAKGWTDESQQGADWANVALGMRSLTNPAYVTAKLAGYWAVNSPVTNEVNAGVTYYYAHANQNYGQIQWNYHTNIPTSTVYYNSRTGKYTYVVCNTSDSAQTCTVYRDGSPIESFTVPANSIVAVNPGGVLPTPIVTATPTPTRAATPTPGGNLALGKTVTVSSTENDGTPGSAAVDGNNGTRWSSAASDPQWIYVDLGASYNINRVLLNWETAYARTYTIQVSTNATNWTNVYSTTTGDGGVDDITFTATNARYVRMYGTVRATVWGYSLWEFEVYGTGTATPTPTRTATATPTPTRAATATPTPIGSEVVAPIFGATASSAITPANESCDGNTGTRWESNHGVDPQWIYWDLGSNKSLVKIVIDWEVASAANYTIQGSTNGTSWTNLATVTNSSTANHNIITTNISGSYRYVRMYGTTRTTGWGYSIWETTIYVSGGATPTPTRAVTATPTPTPSSANLALGKSVAVSSTENGGTPGTAAVDGNTGTRWASAFSDPQWIRVDLGQSYSISRVVLNWEAAAGKSYQIQTSTDGSNWSTAWSTTSGNGGVVTATFSPRNARYVRMYGTQRTTGYGYSLWEFEVYQQ